MPAKKLRVAIVHDWLTDFGGAERVLLAMHEIWPDAPIFTTLYRPDNLPQFAGADVRTSYLQQIPGAAKRHRLLLPFMPAAVEAWDFSDFDVVVSTTSSGCAKGVITKPETLHVCYCHNPSRVLWDGSHEYISLHKPGFFKRLVMPSQLRKLRIWDRCAADRVDLFVANSEFVGRRIEKYYQAKSKVIYPPVETRDFEPTKNAGDYFLAVGRLIPYKRFDLAIQAANILGAKLKIVGVGPELENLKKIAGPTIEFAGKLSEEDLRQAYAECKALIFPQVEDFGLTPVEVQASGRPVVAYAAGGALETVVPRRTGIFFKTQTPAALADAMAKVETVRWVKPTILKNAARFDIENFKKKLDKLVTTAYKDWQKR